MIKLNKEDKEFNAEVTLLFKTSKGCPMCNRILNSEYLSLKEGEVLIIRPTFNASGILENYHMEVSTDPIKGR